MERQNSFPYAVPSGIFWTYGELQDIPQVLQAKKQLKNDPFEWQIFENTHETVIDQETYDIVQRIRDGRCRVTPLGEMPVLSGMVFCADCGAKLY